LFDFARSYRYGTHNALVILLAYRRGLRAAEVTDQAEQTDFAAGSVRRCWLQSLALTRVGVYDQQALKETRHGEKEEG
jgi:hypothetical protein